ncbi:MAG: MCE family protein [Polyangiaceae bacterium]|nr:MCE family protein [Polyangiaceae bacterium]
MASPRSIEVKVGILILTAIGLLAAFVIIMGGVNFQATYPIYVEFDNPGGLQAGAPVKIAGVKVGKISEIQFRGAEVSDSGKRDPLVRMKVTIEKRYQKSVRENSLFYVTTQGVLGEQFLAIEPGSQDRPSLPDGAIVRGIDPPRLDMLLSESYELLHTSVQAIRENRKEFSEAFDGLRKTLKGTGELMDKNGDKFDRIVTNVETMTAEGVDTVKDARAKYVNNPAIDRIVSNADSLAAVAARDTPPILADAKVTMANAKRISTTLGGEEEQAKMKQAINDVVEVTARVKKITADAEVIVGQIKRGKGTAGALLMDEQLYDDLQEMVRDVKHNPWKFFWRE